MASAQAPAADDSGVPAAAPTAEGPSAPHLPFTMAEQKNCGRRSEMDPPSPPAVEAAAGDDEDSITAGKYHDEAMDVPSPSAPQTKRTRRGGRLPRAPKKSKQAAVKDNRRERDPHFPGSGEEHGGDSEGGGGGANECAATAKSDRDTAEDEDAAEEEEEGDDGDDDDGDGDDDDSDLCGFVKPLFKSPVQAALSAAYRAREERAVERQTARKNVEDARRLLESALADERAATDALEGATREVFELELTEPCRWNEMLGRLKRYVDAHGHCRMSHNASFDDSKKEERELKELSIWLVAQKSDHKTGKGTLPRAPHRIEALEKLGVVWTESFADRWSKRFKQLEEFRESYGHCNVGIHVDAELHRWVGNQRQDYARFLAGKPCAITKERITSLESIGFQWKAQFNNCPAGAERWQFMYNRLREYKETHGHTNVPPRDKCGHDEDLRQLSLWVRYQRDHYTSGKLGKTPERLEALRALGFEFYLSKEDKWLLRLRELLEFRDKNGHCRVPMTNHDNPKLAVWVKNLRSHLSKFSRGERCMFDAYPSRLEMLKTAGIDLRPQW